MKKIVCLFNIFICISLRAMSLNPYADEDLNIHRRLSAQRRAASPSAFQLSQPPENTESPMRSDEDESNIIIAGIIYTLSQYQSAFPLPSHRN